MKKYWVYIHTTPDGMVYVGFSGAKHTSDRWKPSAYKQTSLQPYIEKWGWENIKHEVVKDNLSKEDAFKIEDELIKFYKERGVCINTYNSGGLQCDGKNNEYDKQYYQKHKEQYKEYYQTHKDEKSKYSKEWREKNKEYLREYEKNRIEKKREQHKQWIEKHREEYNRYMREYRKKKKEVV